VPTAWISYRPPVHVDRVCALYNWRGAMDYCVSMAVHNFWLVFKRFNLRMLADVLERRNTTFYGEM
jgi:hypothetical protein